MHKILYAINHRATEDAITQRISGQYLVMGAVTYKEAVLAQLKATGADTLLVRETLPGSITMEQLLKRVRVEFPETRIVVICSERPKQDPFLQRLVSLAVYDIINSDKVGLGEICSYILTPRTFRDAAQYGIGLPEVPNGSSQTVCAAQPEQSGQKKNSFLDTLIKGIGSLRRPAEPAAPALGPERKIAESPRVDYELLRESMKETEARRAQHELDAMIQKAVELQTASLRQEKEALCRELESMRAELLASEGHSAGVIEELDALRSEKDRLNILLSDTRRDMQSVIDLYESQLKALHDPTNTPEWYSEQSKLWESQRESLSAALKEKTQEAQELSFQVEALTRQVRESSSLTASLKEQVQRAQDMQLSGRGCEELIAKLRAELSQAKEQTAQMSHELASAREELELAREGGPDYSRPLTDVPLLPDDTIYTPSRTCPQTMLIMGAKHGVGNTTVALNLASSLAGRGYKTLLIEANSAFPLLNEYFELTHIPFGFEEAINAVAAGEIPNIDRSIIRLHALRPTQSALYKTYRRLPPGLHFLLMSNQSLVSRSYEKNPLLTEAAVYTLLSYLSKRQQYSHIILDIQCDDMRLFQCLLNSGYPIDKLCLTLSQDPHALASAGYQITSISRAHASSLVAGGEFIINRFNAGAPITQQKVEKMLRLGPKQISRCSEDSTGYLAAANAGIPYLLNKGRYWMEYDVLRGKICPSS